MWLLLKILLSWERKWTICKLKGILFVVISCSKNICKIHLQRIYPFSWLFAVKYNHLLRMNSSGWEIVRYVIIYFRKTNGLKIISFQNFFRRFLHMNNKANPWFWCIKTASWCIKNKLTRSRIQCLSFTWLKICNPTLHFPM